MSHFGTIRLMVETPVMWVVLAIVTALLALLSRRVAGVSVSPWPSSSRHGPS